MWLFSQEAKKCHTGAPQYPKKIGKSLPENLILQGGSEFSSQLKFRIP